MVLGGGVNALGVVRALARAGIPAVVVYVDGNDEHLARYSRHCSSIRVQPGQSSEHHLLGALLSRTVEDSKPGFLFATSDYYVTFISHYREALAQHYDFILPDQDVLEVLVDKETSTNAARDAGLHVPYTMVPRRPEEVEAAIEAVPFPCIIKPRDSFSVAFPGKNMVAESPDELVAFLRDRPALLGRVVIQQIIPGTEGNIYQCTTFVSAVDAPLVHFTMRKIHQFPPGYGITTLGVSERNEELVACTEQFLRHIGLVGFASVEYKRSIDDGRYYFIEANPRLPWYNSLFLASGVNFPAVALGCQHDRAAAFPENRCRKDDIQWLYFRNELAGWWSRKKTPDGESLGDLLRSVRRSRAFAYWSLADPLPFIMASADFLRWSVRKLLDGRKRRRA